MKIKWLGWICWQEEKFAKRPPCEVGGTLAKLAPEHNLEISYIEISKDKAVIVLQAKAHVDTLYI